MTSMNNVKLPGPETRCVVFQDTIFKVKYKLSSKNILGEVKCKFNGVQTDIKELTASILTGVKATGNVFPARTNSVAVFPRLLSWVAVHKLEFSYKNRMLKVYPNAIFMMVYIIPPPFSDRPNASRKRVNVPPVLGKHKLGKTSIPYQEEEMTSRQKRPRRDYEEHNIICKGEDAHTIADTPHECARLLNSQRCCGVEHETIVQDHHKNRSEQSQQRPSTSILYRMISMVRNALGW